MSHLSFAKGHGTENDFIVIRDRHNLTPLTPDLVRAICDRHAGIGGDGIVRAVKAGCMPEWGGDPSLWFMDYWNPDGSLAEMCGNGLRVFVRYLIEEDLVPRNEVSIATRAGLRTAWEKPGGALRTDMGQVSVGQPTWVEAGGARFDAVSANVGNPHAVVMLPKSADLGGIGLWGGVVYDQALFPEGVNTEFVQQVGECHLRMRVFERGAGETRSCGTGVVAAAAVARQLLGAEGPWKVDVPGGRLSVDFDGGQAFLTGPAVIIARGELVMPD